jgi:hypothetical protein
VSIVVHQIDAFTEKAFGGNPAVACLLEDAPDTDWMQAVAREMNLSETAFVVRRKDGDWSLRWFTPGTEVDLCGHATLASAHFLWDLALIAPDEPARFHTRSGVLTCVREDEWIAMDFPALPTEAATNPDAARGTSWPNSRAPKRFGTLTRIFGHSCRSRNAVCWSPLRGTVPMILFPGFSRQSTGSMKTPSRDLRTVSSPRFGEIASASPRCWPFKHRRVAAY